VHPIGVGEVVFVAGGESHRPGDGRAAAEGGEYRTLYVPSSDWRRALRDAGLGEVSPLDPVIGDPVLAAELLRLHRRADSGAVPDLDWDILVDRTLARLAAHLGGAPKKRPAAGGRRLERARAYLHANADRRVRLEHLAALAGMNPAHLCRSFSDAYGTPPHRYQTALRVSRAKRLLAAGLPPSKAATQLGFADPSHFGRVFRSFVGVSPGAYAHAVRS
jgi:AraC-like DNA-binding protein